MERAFTKQACTGLVTYMYAHIGNLTDLCTFAHTGLVGGRHHLRILETTKRDQSFTQSCVIPLRNWSNLKRQTFTPQCAKQVVDDTLLKSEPLRKRRRRKSYTNGGCDIQQPLICIDSLRRSRALEKASNIQAENLHMHTRNRLEP